MTLFVLQISLGKCVAYKCWGPDELDCFWYYYIGTVFKILKTIHSVSCRQTNRSSLLKHCSTFFFDQKCPTFCFHWLAYSKIRIERLNCQNLRFSQLYCHINYMLLYQIVSCLTLLYIALIFFQDTEIHVTTVGAGVLKQSCITGKVSVLKF